MSTLREAAQQALEALEQRDNATLWHQAIHALRDALAQEEQEQVTWMLEDTDKRYFIFRTHRPVAREGETLTPLYTHPPRREWQSLTDKEIRCMGIETPGQQGGWNLAFARAVEAALKEKNNG